MADTKIALANIALDLIGAATILSFDDDSNEARIVKRMYESSKKTVLRSHPWNCARKRVVLSPLTELPAFAFSYKFKLPTDCLRILPYASLVGTSYEIDQRHLLCDLETINLQYIANVTDTTLFDALVDDAIATKLASNICYRLVQSTSLAEKMSSDYERILRRAKTMNAQEQQEQSLQSETWLDSRLQGV